MKKKSVRTGSVYPPLPKIKTKQQLLERKLEIAVSALQLIITLLKRWQTGAYLIASDALAEIEMTKIER